MKPTSRRVSWTTAAFIGILSDAQQAVRGHSVPGRDRGSSFTVPFDATLLPAAIVGQTMSPHAALSVQGALVRYVVGVAVYHLADSLR